MSLAQIVLDFFPVERTKAYLKNFSRAATVVANGF